MSAPNAEAVHNSPIEWVSEEKWRKDVPAGLEYGLPNYWYPIALSAEVLTSKPMAVTALCEDLMIWRDNSGVPHIFVNSCPHRAVRLSVGFVLATVFSAPPMVLSSMGAVVACASHGRQMIPRSARL